VIQPVVLANVSNDMEIAQNEIFGPVASIITFNGDDEAIAFANDTNLGLSGAVHSRSTERALKVAHQVKTGMIHINDQSVNDDANAIFGGEKQSGIGRFNGDFVKEKFTTTKWVTVQHEDREYAL
jgi:aldehyde dehydrogenase (NAD+)